MMLVVDVIVMMMLVPWCSLWYDVDSDDDVSGGCNSDDDVSDVCSSDDNVSDGCNSDDDVSKWWMQWLVMMMMLVMNVIVMTVLVMDVIVMMMLVSRCSLKYDVDVMPTWWWC